MIWTLASHHWAAFRKIEREEIPRPQEEVRSVPVMDPVKETIPWEGAAAHLVNKFYGEKFYAITRAGVYEYQ